MDNFDQLSAFYNNLTNITQDELDIFKSPVNKTKDYSSLPNLPLNYSKDTGKFEFDKTLEHDVNPFLNFTKDEDLNRDKISLV